MHRRIALAAILLLGLAPLIVPALQRKRAPVSLRQTFEKGEEGWVAYGPGAQVRITHEPANVKEGSGALELDYKVVPNQFGSAVLLVGDGSLQKMARLRFWLKTDVATAVAVVLSEKKPDGGDYAAWFWSPKDRWQLIDFTGADFALNEGPGDAKDPNGKLDLDRYRAWGSLISASFSC